MTHVHSLSILLIALTGCGEDTTTTTLDPQLSADLREDTHARSRWEGTPEGLAIVNFLNEETTTHDVLDNDVPLDRRTADNLIAHRNGDDLVYSTNDDNLFNDMTEVDDVSWVGPGAISRLISHVDHLGLIPSGDDPLGVYDGVEFTVEQALNTVDLVNASSFDYLDQTLGLDRRTATSIMDAQPIDSVAHLAGLYFVGGWSLSVISSVANSPEPFDETTQSLYDNTLYDISESVEYYDISDIPTSIHEQLVVGFQAEGINVDNADQILPQLDDHSVYVSEIVSHTRPYTYSWLSFYMGDTEVGYIFRTDSLLLAAIVSDGDILIQD